MSGPVLAANRLGNVLVADLTRHGFSSRVVLPDGQGTTSVLICLESPGELEDRDLIPLNPKAPSGSLFARLARLAGFERDAFRITNTVWTRPPDNQLEGEVWEDEAVESWRSALDDEIARFQPCVIIAMGNVALRRLTKFGRQKRGMITSVQNYFIDTPYGLVLPMLHPASMLPHKGESKGSPELYGAFIWGLKCAVMAASRGWERQSWRYLTRPNHDEALKFFAGFNPDHHILSYDIETPKSGGKSEDELDDESFDIKRISFAYDLNPDAPFHGISFPFQEPFIGIVKEVLGKAKVRASWNGYCFDDPRLRASGITLGGELRDWWDWHFLCPTMPMGLDYAAPLCGWRNEPWKYLDEGEPELYSAMDAVARLFIHQNVTSILRSQNRFDIYHRHCVQLMQTMDRISVNGLPLDKNEVESFTIRMEALAKERFDTLQQIVPDELRELSPENGYKHPPKDVTGMVQRHFVVPPSKLTKAERTFLSGECELLPDECSVLRWCRVEPFLPTSTQQIQKLVAHYGAKVGTNRKTKKPTTDAETLKKLIRDCEKSHNPKLNELGHILKLSKECRQLSKVIGTYARGWKPGADGRIHSTPGMWGAMFRLSWRDPNIAATIQDKQEQYVAAGFRRCVRAKKGKVLLEHDWRGIEALLVGYFAGDQDYMRLVRLGVHDYLTYYLLADRKKIPQSAIPSLSLSDAELRGMFKQIKKEFPKDRDDAKHCIHGTNYMLSPFGMAALYELELSEAKKIQNIYFNLFPKIREWQNRVLMQADRDHKLRTVWSYEMPFWEVRRWNSRKNRGEGGWDIGEEAKSAVAFLPRDTAAGMLKEVLLSKPLQELVAQGYTIATAHDSILHECPESEVMDVGRIVKREMEREWPQLGNLVVEVEAKVGPSWSDEMEVITLDQANPIKPDASISTTVCA